ncbi:hypothetical protein ACVNP0_11835 [Staphylococcus aureus]
MPKRVCYCVNISCLNQIPLKFMLKVFLDLKFVTQEEDGFIRNQSTT